MTGPERRLARLHEILDRTAARFVNLERAHRDGLVKLDAVQLCAVLNGLDEIHEARRLLREVEGG